MIVIADPRIQIKVNFNASIAINMISIFSIFYLLLDYINPLGMDPYSYYDIKLIKHKYAISLYHRKVYKTFQFCCTALYNSV